MIGFWSTERIEVLKAGWLAGDAAWAIADAIGDGCTKNMVIGKAHRLKLPDHQYHQRRKAAKPHRKAA